MKFEKRRKFEIRVKYKKSIVQSYLFFRITSLIKCNKKKDVKSFHF